MIRRRTRTTPRRRNRTIRSRDPLVHGEYEHGAKPLPIASAQPAWDRATTTGVRRGFVRSGYTRVRYIAESRKAELRTRPAPANAHVRPLPDPQSVNPFDNAPQHIPAHTLQLSPCPACQAPGGSCWVCYGPALVGSWQEIQATQPHSPRPRRSRCARRRGRLQVACTAAVRTPNAWTRSRSL